MKASKKSLWVLNCYGWGTVQLVTGEQVACLLLEHARWGSLEQQLADGEGNPQGLTPEVCREVMFDVLHGLENASSSSGAIHRDIKPANILLCDPPPGMKPRHRPWIAKLADWGTSAVPKGPCFLASTVQFTPAYQAPEMRKGYRHDSRLDSWCMGLLLLHIRSGRLPFLYLWEQGLGEEERNQRRSGGFLNSSTVLNCFDRPVEAGVTERICHGCRFLEAGGQQGHLI